jgi:hypothetical protein
MMNEIINFFSFWKEQETDFIPSRNWRWPSTFYAINELQEEEILCREEEEINNE